MGPRVEIDLNIRVRGSGTYAGLEDVHGGPVLPDDFVTVFESETGVEGNARVSDIDYERGLVYLIVDWRSLGEPAQDVAPGLATYLTYARLSLGGASTTQAATPSQAAQPVACSA